MKGKGRMFQRQWQEQHGWRDMAQVTDYLKRRKSVLGGKVTFMPVLLKYFVWCNYSHFTDEAIAVREGEVTCSESS